MKPSERDHWAGELTLAAVRSTVQDPHAVLTNRYVVLPRAGLLSHEETVEHLVRLRKPLLCVPLTVFGGIGIGCWEMTTAPDRAWWKTLRRVKMGKEARRRAIQSNDPRILLGIGSDIGTNGGPFSLDVMDHWENTYEVLGTGYSLVEPDEQAKALGASAMLRFYKSADRELAIAFLDQWPRS